MSDIPREPTPLDDAMAHSRQAMRSRNPRMIASAQLNLYGHRGRMLGPGDLDAPRRVKLSQNAYTTIGVYYPEMSAQLRPITIAASLLIGDPGFRDPEPANVRCRLTEDIYAGGASNTQELSSFYIFPAGAGELGISEDTLRELMRPHVDGTPGLALWTFTPTMANNQVSLTVEMKTTSHPMVWLYALDIREAQLVSA